MNGLRFQQLDKTDNLAIDRADSTTIPEFKMSSCPERVFRIRILWLIIAILACVGCQKSNQNQSAPENELPSNAAVSSDLTTKSSEDAAIEETLSQKSSTDLLDGDLTLTPDESPQDFVDNDKKIATDLIPESRLLDAPPTGEAETQEIMEAYVGPDQVVRQRMSPPPDAKPVGRDNHLWIDREQGQVIADGYVTMRRGVLEMFACPMGTKEHEAVVATLAKSKEVHAALLAIGAVPGTPVQFLPKFVPATGQLIRVWVCWRDLVGDFHAIDARQWVHKVNSNTPLEAEWVFAGSGFWKDPADGREYYQADGGDMICVSNFSTAMIDISIASSAESDQLMYQPATDMLPERGTPVRLVLVPIPNPIDTQDEEVAQRWNEETERKKNTPPTERILAPLKPLATPLEQQSESGQ